MTSFAAQIERGLRGYRAKNENPSNTTPAISKKLAMMAIGTLSGILVGRRPRAAGWNRAGFQLEYGWIVVEYAFRRTGATAPYNNRLSAAVLGLQRVTSAAKATPDTEVWVMHA